MLAMLFAYRKKCASDSPAGQLILPEALRVLPLFTLCTHKMLALRPNAQVCFVCGLRRVVVVEGSCDFQRLASLTVRRLPWRNVTVYVCDSEELKRVAKERVLEAVCSSLKLFLPL